MVTRDKKGTLLDGRFQVEEVLSQGGMSILFAGTDVRTNRSIAIKYLRSFDIGKARKRFQNEIQTASRLKHPNIVKLIDSGYDENGTPFLVMELLHGVSLEQELATRGKFDVPRVLQWLLPLVGALRYAHQNGVIHRDLKPANIFLSRSQDGSIVPKLLDFGISLVSDATRITRSGSIIGTVQYMSPEQARDEPVGPPTDVWAMGVIFYYALTGTLPFQAGSAAGLLYKIVNESPVDLISMGTQAGPKFCATVDRALAKEVSRRYPDMLTFARALCLSARAERFDLPEAPDPIGLPDWPLWLRGDSPEHAITEEVDTWSPPVDRSLSESSVRLKPEETGFDEAWATTYDSDDSGISRSKSHTPFVGRKKEVDQLFRAFGRAEKGRGQAVAIVGEAGVGKSRLLLEMKRRIDSHQHLYLEGACQQQFGNRQNYLPILQLLRTYFALKEGDDPTRVKRNLQERLLALDRTLLEILPALSEFFFVETKGGNGSQLDVHERKRSVWEAVRTLLVRISQDQTLVIAIEDLHWADKNSEAFIDYLIDSLVDSPILLLLLFRSEYSRRAESRLHYHEIALTRLDAEQSNALLHCILGRDDLVDTDLKHLIWERARGNPLHTEELVHTSLATKAIRKHGNRYSLESSSLSVADINNVQQIVSYRMNRLEQASKRILQIASVLGPDFVSKILSRIAGLQDELDAHLGELQQMRFIYRKRGQDDNAFAFKHALIRQTAYESLPEDKRRDIHRKIAETLEEAHRGNLNDFYETLAYHYVNAENWEKACLYLRLSSEKAARSYSYEVAVQFLTQAIAILSKLPQTEDNQKEQLGLRVRLCSQYIMQGYPPSALENAGELEVLAKTLGDAKSLALSYSARNAYYAHTGNEKMSSAYADLAIEEALKSREVELLASIISTLFTVYCAKSQFNRILEIAPRAIELFEQEGRTSDSFDQPILTFPWVCVTYGIALALSGDFPRGIAVLDKAFAIANEQEHLPTLGLVEAGYGALYSMKGDARPCIDHANNGLNHLEGAEWFWTTPIIMSIIGIGYYFLGDLATAKVHLENACKTSTDNDVNVWFHLPYTNLSLVLSELGEYRQARKSADRALQIAKDSSDPLGEAMAFSQIGLALGQCDPTQHERAEQMIRQAFDIYERLGLRATAAVKAAALARLFRDTHQKHRAIQCLDELHAGIREMEAMQMGFWLDKAREYLDQVLKS